MMFELEHVTKAYGSHRALDDVSIRVGPGSLGLLGPNGAGKSTLIKLLLGLVKLTSGRATVLGHDVRDSLSIRQSVGYMPEDDCYIAGLRGVEMVARAGELAGMDPLTALRRAHEMLDYVRLGESRYREVQTFSTGMKQRIRFAMALVHSPKLVLLDEPTSGMDPDGREQLLHLIRELAQKKGVSVVISTHILHDVEQCCDSVMIIGRGKLLKHDTIANLHRSIDSSLTVRIGQSDTGALVRALEQRGVSTETKGPGAVVVDGDGDVMPDVLASVRDVGAPLHGITPARNSLETIFLESLRGTDADS